MRRKTDTLFLLDWLRRRAVFSSGRAATLSGIDGGGGGAADAFLSPVDGGVGGRHATASAIADVLVRTETNVYVTIGDVRRQKIVPSLLRDWDRKCRYVGGVPWDGVFRMICNIQSVARYLVVCEASVKNQQLSGQDLCWRGQHFTEE